jgi:hypothetical protein
MKSFNFSLPTYRWPLGLAMAVILCIAGLIAAVRSDDTAGIQSNRLFREPMPLGASDGAAELAARRRAVVELWAQVAVEGRVDR